MDKFKGKNKKGIISNLLSYILVPILLLGIKVMMVFLTPSVDVSVFKTLDFWVDLLIQMAILVVLFSILSTMSIKNKRSVNIPEKLSLSLEDYGTAITKIKALPNFIFKVNDYAKIEIQQRKEDIINRYLSNTTITRKEFNEKYINNNKAIKADKTLSKLTKHNLLKANTFVHAKMVNSESVIYNSLQKEDKLERVANNSKKTFATKITTKMVYKVINTIAWVFGLQILTTGSIKSNIEPLALALNIASSVFLVVMQTISAIKLSDSIIDDDVEEIKEKIIFLEEAELYLKNKPEVEDDIQPRNEEMEIGQ